MSDDVGMPPPGKPDARRCRWCGATKRIRHEALVCVGCDFTHADPPGAATFPDHERNDDVQ